MKTLLPDARGGTLSPRAQPESPAQPATDERNREQAACNPAQRPLGFFDSDDRTSSTMASTKKQEFLPAFLPMGLPKLSCVDTRQESLTRDSKALDSRAPVLEQPSLRTPRNRYWKSRL